MQPEGAHCMTLLGVHKECSCSSSSQLQPLVCSVRCQSDLIGVVNLFGVCDRQVYPRTDPANL